MSELLDKQVNPQKESFKKILSGFTQAPASPQKVCDENEPKKQTKKQHTCKNVFGKRREIIGCMWKTHAMDFNKFQVDDC